MGNLIGNSRIYNIHAENEVAEILSHFSIEFIRVFIKDQMSKNILNYNPVVPPTNMVNSLEQNFKQLIEAYPEERPNIWERRTIVYKEIVTQIISTYELQLPPDYESRSGWYAEAVILYDFFIGNFLNYAIYFFSDAIILNANDIYKYLKLDERKDITTYTKKVYANNVKLGVLLNNIDAVISTIAGFDFTLDDIFRIVYGTQPSYDTISSFVSDMGDFYKKFYISLFQSEIQTMLVTEIRLAIHSKYIANTINTTPVNTMEVNNG